MSVLKKEFIDRMAETGGITKKEAGKGAALFIEALMECMSEDERVMIYETYFVDKEGRTVKIKVPRPEYSSEIFS